VWPALLPRASDSSRHRGPGGTAGSQHGLQRYADGGVAPGHAHGSGGSVTSRAVCGAGVGSLHDHAICNDADGNSDMMKKTTASTGGCDSLVVAGECCGVHHDLGRTGQPCHAPWSPRIHRIRSLIPRLANGGDWHHGANPVRTDGVRGGWETCRRGNRGGRLGIIGGGYGDADWLDREFAAAGMRASAVLTWSLANKPELPAHVLSLLICQVPTMPRSVVATENQVHTGGQCMKTSRSECPSREREASCPADGSAQKAPLTASTDV